MKSFFRSVSDSLTLLLLLLSVMSSQAVMAHHSIAVFDTSREVEIVGKVVKWSYTNPHCWIDVEVTGDDGSTVVWGIEMGSQAQLRSQGWGPDTLQPGDQLRAVLYPRRDGTPAGNTVLLTYSDGSPIIDADDRYSQRRAKQEPSARQATTLEMDPHPLVADLVPKMMFSDMNRKPPEVEHSNLPTADPRDFSGRYYPNGTSLILPGGKTRILPYNDAGAALFRERAVDFIEGVLREDVLSLCKPAGLIRSFNMPFQFQIVQSSSQVNIVSVEDHIVRRIYIDQQHPADLKPSFMGHSVGHWEGDTLVVDSVGFRDGWMDEYGSPSSEALHVIERISKGSDGTLSFDITFEDPAYYSEPVNFERSWRWNPEGTWDEVICEENNRDAPVSASLTKD